MSTMSPVDMVQARSRAEERARAVATMSGVSVRELTEHAEHVEAERLVSEIWQSEALISRTVLRMLSSIGGYVAGAYRGAELVGITVGFVTAPDSSAKCHLHSYIAGTAPQYRGQNVGWAIKLHQRAWALEHGLETISWTFDPLLRRNAFFNLMKLGANASSYITDFYGQMSDGINQNQGSDRLWLTWELCSEKAKRAAEGDPGEPDLLAMAASAEVALSVGADGGPQENAIDDRARVLVCAVPADIEALRLTDAGLALTWRVALRRAMTTALEHERRIEGCTRAGLYVLVDKRDEATP